MSINQYTLLGRRRRGIARKVARRVYLDRPNDVFSASHGDALAEVRLRERVRNQLLLERQFCGVFGSIWVSLAISLAIRLLMYWLLNSEVNPSSEGFQPGEPGA